MFRVQTIWHDILEHPLVQYIPLNKDPIVSRQDVADIGTQLNIRAFNAPADLRPTLIRFGLDTEILNTIDWDHELPIISINMISKELKYRTTKVVVLAERKHRFFEIFTVNRDYFYRDFIFFSVYDEQGRRMSTPTTMYPIDHD